MKLLKKIHRLWVKYRTPIAIVGAVLGSIAALHRIKVDRETAKTVATKSVATRINVDDIKSNGIFTSIAGNSDGEFRVDEEIKLTLLSRQKVYFKIYQVDQASSRTTLIYPSPRMAASEIDCVLLPNQETKVPGEWGWKASPPLGDYKHVLFVSKQRNLTAVEISALKNNRRMEWFNKELDEIMVNGLDSEFTASNSGIAEWNYKVKDYK